MTKKYSRGRANREDRQRRFDTKEEIKARKKDKYSKILFKKI